jgi:hypothetical protein
LPSSPRSARVEHEFRLRVSGRTFTGRAVRGGDRIHAAFDAGPVTLRKPTSAETDLVVAALGVAPDLLTSGTCVASEGPGSDAGPGRHARGRSGPYP